MFLQQTLHTSVMKFISNLTHYDARFEEEGKSIFTYVCLFLQNLTKLILQQNIEILSQEMIYKKITRTVKYACEIFVNLHEFQFFNLNNISKIPALKEQVQSLCQSLFYMIHILPIEEVSKNYMKMKVFYKSIYLIIQNYIEYLPLLNDDLTSIKMTGKLLSFLWAGIQSDNRTNYISVYHQFNIVELNLLLEKVIKANTEEMKKIKIFIQYQEDVLLHILDICLCNTFKCDRKDQNELKIIFAFLKLNPGFVYARINETIPESAILNENLKTFMIQCQMPNLQTAQSTFMKLMIKK